jgi:hypothetical protein
MKIEIKTAADGETEVMLSEVYSGVGIQTAAGLFGIAERDGGIEVLLDGKTVWATGEGDYDGDVLATHEEYAAALKLVELWVKRDPPAGSVTGYELWRLAGMVERYEKLHCPFPGGA